MTIGLDLGSHQFRSIRSLGDKLAVRSCPAVFATLADTPVHRRLLQQSETCFATCSGQLLIFGDSAQEWSAMLNLSLIPLIRGGRIPKSDSISRQVLALMIDALLPAPIRPGTLCQMTLPGGGFDQQIENRDAEFFRQLVSLRGYRPQFMTATLALALAEMNDNLFSGIAITVGHSTCEFGIVHCGREVLRCVVMSGMEQFEGVPMLGSPDVSREQMSSASVEREYSRFFIDLVAEARSQFEHEGSLKTMPQPMPVVCAGGITQAPGFLSLFQRAWDESHWPIPTRPIRIANNANLAVVRGCLIQAELDQPIEHQVA